MEDNTQTIESSPEREAGITALFQAFNPGFAFDADHPDYAYYSACFDAFEPHIAETVRAASEKVWGEAYPQGVNDEQISASNIGIAGLGGKIGPARANPYTVEAIAQAAK